MYWAFHFHDTSISGKNWKENSVQNVSGIISVSAELMKIVASETNCWAPLFWTTKKSRNYKPCRYFTAYAALSSFYDALISRENCEQKSLNENNTHYFRFRQINDLRMTKHHFVISCKDLISDKSIDISHGKIWRKKYTAIWIFKFINHLLPHELSNCIL